MEQVSSTEIVKSERSIQRSIRTRRLELKLSQRGLADAAGTTPAAICQIEKGKRNPSAALLVRIAEALGCSTDQLFSGKRHSRPEEKYIDQAIAAMKGLPQKSQREVVEFCNFLRFKEGRKR